MKAIIFGEYTKATYHPFEGVDREFVKILSEFDIECTEDYEQFKAANLKKFDLCISYTDHWTERLSDEQTAGLLSFVCGGGGLLAVHNGISIQSRYELAQLAGARFKSHPEMKMLSYYAVPSGHMIMEGIEGFSLMEEPYQFEFDAFCEKTMLLEYESEGKRWPAAWALNYGLGRVVYLSPGHSVDSFLDPMIKKMILKSAQWAAIQC